MLNPSNPMESEMPTIGQVFRTVHLGTGTQNAVPSPDSRLQNRGGNPLSSPATSYSIKFGLLAARWLFFKDGQKIKLDQHGCFTSILDPDYPVSVGYVHGVRREIHLLTVFSHQEHRSRSVIFDHEVDRHQIFREQRCSPRLDPLCPKSSGGTFRSSAMTCEFSLFCIFFHEFSPRARMARGDHGKEPSR
jgi:hypothetical protein